MPLRFGTIVGDAGVACPESRMAAGGMFDRLPAQSVHRRLVAGLHVEAMLLADEARHYFDGDGRRARERLSPIARVAFSCESLKVTTRLMHVIAWLLTQRAVLAGEMAARDAADPSRRLGEAPVTDAAALADLPAHAGALVVASIDLHRRVARLDSSADAPIAVDSPVRAMQERIATAF